MKKQKILAMLLSVLMLFSIPTIAFAAETDEDLSNITASAIVPYGNDYPTSVSDLPYYSVKSKFSSYNYTAKRVPPTNSGTLWSSFSFKYEGTGSVTLTVTLYKYNSSTSATKIGSYSLNASSVTHNTKQWTGLNPGSTYFIGITKTGTDKGLMKVGLGATQASASNYSF